MRIICVLRRSRFYRDLIEIARFSEERVVVSVEMYVAVGEEEKERKERDRDEGSRR